jgi:3D (Asp-Asp-Asp) domain-containing protein
LPSTGTGLSTAYGPPWGGIQGGGTTATGIDLHGSPHKLIVAVDPSVIPLGSKLKIWPNPFGNPKLIFTAADTGGAIKSPHLFDFYDWRGRQTQLAWGQKTVRYQIVGKGPPTAAGVLGGAASPGSPAAAGGAGGAGGASFAGVDIAGMLKEPLLRALMYVALVAGGVVLAGYGTYRVANASSGGQLARVARKVPVPV